MTSREAYITLNALEGVGPITVSRLVAHFGDAAAVLDAPAGALQQVAGVGPKLSAVIARARTDFDVAAELARAEQTGTTILTPLDAAYPECLRRRDDAPLALYVRGTLLPRDTQGLAIVGTRHPTLYARETAQHFARQLAELGYTIVSGLALGIDTVAHEAALVAGGRTLAVVGSGFNHLYPAANRPLATRITAQGAVLSELPFARPPDKTTFPMRNRIVAALGRAVLVVEAGAKSGALITANLANEAGQTVMAVPGRIDNPLAAGCHRLIRDGARLVQGVDDILEELGQLPLGPGAAGAAPAAGRRALEPDEQRILDCIDDADTADIDSLIRQTGLAPARVNALLTAMEIRKLVRLLPGQQVGRHPANPAQKV